MPAPSWHHSGGSLSCFACTPSPTQPCKNLHQQLVLYVGTMFLIFLNVQLRLGLMSLPSSSLSATSLSPSPNVFTCVKFASYVQPFSFFLQKCTHPYQIYAHSLQICVHSSQICIRSCQICTQLTSFSFCDYSKTHKANPLFSINKATSELFPINVPMSVKLES